MMKFWFFSSLMKQSTATGLTGNHGAGVHDHVEEEHRSVCVLAPIPHVPMVDHGVLGANRKDNPAMKINCALVNSLNKFIMIDTLSCVMMVLIIKLGINETNAVLPMNWCLRFKLQVAGKFKAALRLVRASWILKGEAIPTVSSICIYRKCKLKDTRWYPQPHNGFSSLLMEQTPFFSISPNGIFLNRFIYYNPISWWWLVLLELLGTMLSFLWIWSNVSNQNLYQSPTSARWSTVSGRKQRNLLLWEIILPR